VIILHAFGVPGLKRALILVSFLLPVSLLFLSCGSSSSSSGSTGSGLKFRAFISQDVNAGNVTPGVQIIDAAKDVRAPVASISAGATPGLMVVTPNRVQTLVFSPADNNLTFISNAGESASGRITLPSFTESIVVSPDSLTGYVALPTAFVGGHNPGVLDIINLNNGAVTAGINIPAVHFLALGHSGNRLLAFSDNSNSVAVISFGTGPPTVTFVDGFDRPVTAFFSGDDNTAFVVNCGAECGGSQASVQKLDLTNTTCPPFGVCPPSPVPVATVAVVAGTTMYLAGTPVPNPDPLPCTGQTTAATSCGLLTIFDLNSMSVVNPAPIIITDGHHNRMALGANGQLFVGAKTCTEIIPPIPQPPDVEVRGCLSIYNTQTGAVVIPPANGDVTGIEPIPNRTVVYLAQGGELQIYDTTTDKLQTTQIDISGEVIDVKTVDF
jgi:hypothetical protein